MSPEFGQAARTLLARDGGSAAELAELATDACETFATHLARLLGDSGIQMLLKRSMLIASRHVPWLPTGAPETTTLTELRLAMEQHDTEAITEAFVAFLSAFVGLLERLIGEGLVDRLLGEVWPSVFTLPAKDSP